MKGVHDFFFQLMKVHTSPQRFPGPLLRSSIPPLRRGPSQPLLVSRPFAGAVCSRYPHISQDHFKKNKFIYARRAIRDLQKIQSWQWRLHFVTGFWGQLLPKESWWSDGHICPREKSWDPGSIKSCTSNQFSLQLSNPGINLFHRSTQAQRTQSPKSFPPQRMPIESLR